VVDCGEFNRETKTNGRIYERANTDSPLRRSSFAAVRVTVAEAKTEVYVSVNASVPQFPRKNKEGSEPAVTGQLRSKQ
jgi:hypothetical protein